MSLNNLRLRMVSGKLFIAFSFLAIALSSSASNGKPSFKSAYGFIENKGQIVDQNYQPNRAVLYLYNSSGLNVQLKTTGFSYEVVRTEKIAKSSTFKTKPEQGPLSEEFNITYKIHRVDISFVGANARPQIIPAGKADDYINYYTSGTGENGATKVGHYKRVFYKDIYPNIDIEFVLNANGFKYNFIVRPGGKVNDIKLQLEGANKTSLTEKGHITIETAYGDIDESIPYSYQLNDQRNEIGLDVSFKKLSDDTYGLNLKQFDQSKTLVIDPAPWALYVGESGSESASGIEVDSDGNVILAGSASMSSNIATSGAYQTFVMGAGDAFIAKFNSSGDKLWGTFFGGYDYETPKNIAVDLNRNIILTGHTGSTTDIATSGSHQTVFGGLLDCFVAKFDSAGVRQWSTYYGAVDYESNPSVVADNLGNIFMGGETFSATQISTSGAHQVSLGGGSDCFVVKFNAAGVRQWATYYGGSGNDYLGNSGLAIDHSGNPVFTGFTNSSTGIASIGAYNTSLEGGGSSFDAFLVKLNSAGVRQWGTYIGDGPDERAHGVIADSSSNIYLTGYTFSPSGIASLGAYQTVINGSSDAFLQKYNSSGSFLWGTYLGGPSDEMGLDVATDLSGNVFMAGYTYSFSNIATPGSLQPDFGGPLVISMGNTDGYIAKFTSLGALTWSSYYGGIESDVIMSVAVNNTGSAFAAGYSGSSNLSLMQNTWGGSSDAFILSLYNDGHALSISNNLISSTTPACFGTSSLITGSTPENGNGSYTYLWLSSTTNTQGSYAPASGTNNGIDYTVTTNTVDKWYKRVVTSAGQSDTSSSFLIDVTPLPSIGFVSNNLPGQCLSGNSFSFSDTSSIVSQSLINTWKFDGDTVTGLNPIKSYNQAGTYSVKLISVSAQGCKDSIEKTITVYPHPSAAFNINDSTQCLAGNSFAFTDLSTLSSGTVSRIWNFGNGDTSSALSVIRTFSTTDSNIVKLISSTEHGCSDSASKTIIVYPQPAVDFSINNDSQCLAGNSFSFNDLSSVSSGSLSRTWMFGSSDSDTSINPVKSYNTAGSYSVKVIQITDNGCTDSASRSFVIHPQPVAGFSINQSSQCLTGNSFVFDDLSSVSTGSFERLWTFENGETDSLSNSVRSYNTPDTYPVKLLSVTAFGCMDSVTKTVTVNPQPLVDFSINADSQCVAGNSFTFTDVSVIASGTTSPSWFMGEGDTSSAISPVKSYATEGSFQVKLIAVSDHGCIDSVSKTIVVHPQPSVNFSINDNSQCLTGNGFVLNDQSSIVSGTTQHLWSFDNTDTSTAADPVKSFSTAGSFEIKLVITSDNGCSDSTSNSVTVYPQPSPDFTIDNDSQCLAGNSFTFTDLSTVSSGSVSSMWNFGDTDTSSAIAPVKSYVAANTYEIKLFAVTDNGCTDSITKNITVHPQPIVNFTIDNDSQCFAGNSFAFTDLSSVSSGTLSHIWDLGDGDTTSASTPVKSYASSLAYEVRLIVKTDFACSDNLIKTVVVHPMPVTAFAINNDSQCFTGNSFAFTDNGTIAGGALSHTWNLGDSTVVSTANPVHSYTNPGTFMVTLLNVSAFGCTDSVQNTVLVHALPAVQLNGPNNGMICPGSVYTLTADAPDAVSYTWKHNNIVLSSVSGSVYSNNITGMYEVNVTDTHSCSSTDNINIQFTVNNTVQPICAVTVDSASNRNMIIWNKINGAAQSGYVVYKETAVANVYIALAFVDADSAAMFIDTLSAPGTKAERYKITTIDTCDNESVRSLAHKSILLQLTEGAGTKWNLSWNAYEGATPVSMNIYRGTFGSAPVFLTSLPGVATSFEDTTGPGGQVSYTVMADFGTTCAPGQSALSKSNTVSAIRTGLNDLDLQTRVHIYPNPSTTGVFMLKNESGNPVSVALFDVNGKLLASTDTILNNGQLDYSSFADGIYMLQIASGDATKHIRLVIAK